MTFYVGQKVVCVDASSDSGFFPPGARNPVYFLDGLSAGSIYTIRAIADAFGYLEISLDEIERPLCHHTGREAGFDARRFRPVVERKTDIAIFKAMLNPSHEQVQS